MAFQKWESFAVLKLVAIVGLRAAPLTYSDRKHANPRHPAKS